MKRQTGANITAALLGLGMLSLVLCLALSMMTGNTLTLNGDGLQMANPKIQSEATRAAMEAADQARLRAVSLDTELKAQPAAVLSKVMIYTAGGIGAIILAVGLAFAAVAWANKRASSIYPNSAGQYPVIVRRGFGWVTFHDPNRGLGPAAVYRTPTLLDVLATTVRYLVTGQVLALPPVQTDFPATADAPIMAQIATQAQVGGIAAAQNKWPRLAPVTGQISAHSADDLSAVLPGPRMPTVRVVDDQAQIEKMERLLLSEGL